MNWFDLFSIKKARLRQIWLYSDSQPTEIVLAFCNIFLAPIAILNEIGSLYFYVVLIAISGVYQIVCVASDDINCRSKASTITFGIYLANSILYLLTVGFPTPTHYGWIVFVLASLGSMGRITREKIHRHG